jgi:hypothetical protein
MRAFTLLICFLLSSQAVFAGGKKWTSPDLEIAVQGLNDVIEGGTWCGLKPDEARHLMLPLRPAWEQSLKALGKRASFTEERKQALSCKTTCTCGLWIVLFDHKPGLKKGEMDLIRQLQKNTSPEDRQSCLKKRTDLCTSLLPELKKVADSEFKSDAAF